MSPDSADLFENQFIQLMHLSLKNFQIFYDAVQENNTATEINDISKENQFEYCRISYGSGRSTSAMINIYTSDIAFNNCYIYRALIISTYTHNFSIS